MVALTKSEIRKILKGRRGALAEEERLQASQNIITHFMSMFSPRQEDVISGYWPIGSEIDIRPLMHELHSKGHSLCLPVVTDTRLLAFKSWKPGDVLIDRDLGLFEPSTDAPEVLPNYVLVPLLGYGEKGERMGYGKGHYDKTLEKLRKTAKITAIGVAFSCQFYPDLPQEPHDQGLDFMLTEQGVMAFAE